LDRLIEGRAGWKVQEARRCFTARLENCWYCHIRTWKNVEANFC